MTTLLIQVQCFDCGQRFAAPDEALREMARRYANRTLCARCRRDTTH